MYFLFISAATRTKKGPFQKGVERGVLVGTVYTGDGRASWEGSRGLMATVVTSCDGAYRCIQTVDSSVKGSIPNTW